MSVGRRARGEEWGCYLHGWTRTRWRKGNIFHKLQPGLGEIRRERSIGPALCDGNIAAESSQQTRYTPIYFEDEESL